MIIDPNTDPRPVEVELFGGPVVRVGGAVCELSPYQAALLTLVAAHGEAGISRPRVGWIMWLEDESPKLRHRIRQLLHRLHEVLGCGVVESDADRLRLAGDVESDLRRYEALMAQRSCSEATGMLLHGFAIKLERYPSEEYEDWVIARRRTMLEELRALATRRWDEASEAGLWGDARDAVESLYMLFPDDVTVVEKLVEARARTGSAASAEEAYARYRLATQGCAVPPLLDELIDRVRRLRSHVSIELTPDEPAPPLVGRREAMARGRSVFEDVRRGRFGVGLITGEGGIGKTRLLQELGREAVLEGFRCLHAQSVEPERRITLNPLIDALSAVDLGPHLRALGEPWRAILGAFLPVGSMSEPLEEIPPIQEAHLSRRLLDALRFLLQKLAEEEATILLLDDIQWADATTITALQFIQRRWNGAPFGIIATTRPELVDSRHPASEYLAGKEDLPVTRIELGELEEPEGRELVRSLVGSDVDDTTTNRLCELAGPHPLFLTELAKDFAAGRLILPEVPTDQIAIPVSLQEILRARVERLSPTALHVAGLLAVRGRPMPLASLVDLTGLPLEHCADAADELLRLRLASFDGDLLRVSHDLFKSALYAHVPEARRVVIHRAIANHLSAHSYEGAHDELAMHFARANDRAAAALHGWRAATRAMESGATAEAAFFFELVSESEDSPERRADATAEQARALHLNRSIGRANPILELAALRLRDVGSPVRALRMDIRRVEGLAEEGVAEHADLISRLRAIKDEARRLGDWEGLALAMDVQIHILHASGDIAALAQLFRELEVVVAEADSSDAIACANATLATGILFGDPTRALEAARAAAATCNRKHDQRLKALLRLLMVLHYRGLMFSTEGLAAQDEAKDLSRTTGDLLLKFSLENNIGVAYMDAGDYDAASVWMHRSSKLLGSAELDLHRFNQASNEGELALAQGDHKGARDRFREASKYLGKTTPPWAADQVHAGTGLAALRMGDLTAARRHELALSEDPDRWYYDPTTILEFRAMMHLRRGEVPRARTLLAKAATDLEDRLVLPFIKITAIQAQMERRHNEAAARMHAEKGLSIAVELDLPHRARAFRRLLR